MFFDYMSIPEHRVTPLSVELQQSSFHIPDTVVISKRRAMSFLRSSPNGHTVDRLTKTSLLQPAALFETLMAAAHKLAPAVTPSTVVAYLVAATYSEELQG